MGCSWQTAKTLEAQAVDLRTSIDFEDSSHGSPHDAVMKCISDSTRPHMHPPNMQGQRTEFPTRASSPTTDARAMELHENACIVSGIRFLTIDASKMEFVVLA